MLNYAAGNLWPDLTFIMDVPVEIGLKRARSSNIEFTGGDRMEREALEFHQQLRNGFLDIAKNRPDKCVLLDATKSIEELHEEVKKVLHKYLWTRDRI
jgi:dTMP kinase